MLSEPMETRGFTMSMSDRELLELAAKAAWIEIVQWQGNCPRVMSGFPIPWNPLDDDGDALRLMVKLKLDILFSPDVVESMANTMKAVEPFGIEKYGDDENAATRRAIVRAAARIGESQCHT